MFSLFGAAATTIAAIGLYGVVAYTTARRSRDIGIRVALGARWFPYCGWPPVKDWRPSPPAEPVLLVQTSLLLFAVAAAAIAVPLGRVLRVSPASVLRLE